MVDAIKSMLDFAIEKEKQFDEIPISHQKLVMKRFEKARSNLEKMLDWEDAKKKLKHK